MIVIRDRDCLPVNGKAEDKPCTSGSRRMAAKGSQKGNCSFLTSQGKGSENTTSTGLLTIKTQTVNSNSYLTPVSFSCHPLPVTSAGYLLIPSIYITSVVWSVMYKSKKYRKI